MPQALTYELGGEHQPTTSRRDQQDHQKAIYNCSSSLEQGNKHERIRRYTANTSVKHMWHSIAVYTSITAWHVTDAETSLSM